jgi:hypothetical protein
MFQQGEKFFDTRGQEERSITTILDPRKRYLSPRWEISMSSHLFRLTGATSWVVPEKYRKTDYLPIIKDEGKEGQVYNVRLTLSLV